MRISWRVTGTCPHAFSDGLEVVLVAALSVVLELLALAVVRVVVPPLEAGVARARGERHRAGVRR